MEYGVDFSKYMDDIAGDLSDDAAENGSMSLKMSGDVDVTTGLCHMFLGANSQLFVCFLCGIGREEIGRGVEGREKSDIVYQWQR